MKIAVFADIHGNYHALEAVLADADETEKVDYLACAGDMVNPFPGSARVWHTLKARNIPMVPGNHEGYVLAYHNPAENPAIRTDVRYMPVRFTAELLPPEIVAGIKALPMSLILPGPNGDDIYMCHGSPTQFRRSFAQGIDEALAAELAPIPQKTLVSGHIHQQIQQYWRGKLLVLCGSVGLPLNTRPLAQYVILTHRGGKWQARHKQVPYNHRAALQETAESGFLTKGGPLAWLFFDELWTTDYRLVPFLGRFCPKPYPTTLIDWQNAAKRYLTQIGRWEALEPYLPHFNGSAVNF